MPTYSYGSGLATALDRTRLRIGDTGPSRWLLGDEEIEAVLGLSAGEWTAAAALCESLAGRFAQDTNTTIEGLGVAKMGRSTYYLNLAAKYRARAVLAGEPANGGGGAGGAQAEAAPVVTGAVASDIAARVADPDRPRSVFDPDCGPYPRHYWPGRWP